MGFDLSLHAKSGNRFFDYGDWRQSRCPLFKEFATEFEQYGMKATRDSTYGEMEYWRLSDFSAARQWISERSARDTMMYDEFRDLATAIVLMEFDETLWFYSSY